MNAPTASPATTETAEPTLELMLERVATARASDLHVVTDLPPRLRVVGELTEITGLRAPTADEVAGLLRRVAPEEHLRQLRPDTEIDFSYADPTGRRYRVSAFHERHGLAIAFRVLAGRPPSLDELELPRDLLRSIHAPGGLVLFVGHAGAGKTTTMASVLQALCERRTARLITLEDPIEYRLDPVRAYVEQREVGLHCASFAVAAREAIESFPDALAIGELRDLETIRLALQAAEMGILVFATVHAYDATRAIGRLVDAFEVDERASARLSLATALRMITAQTLLKRKDGLARVPAIEVVHGGTSLATLIREGKEHELPTLVETSGSKGMRLLDDSLVALARADKVTAEEALLFAVHRETVQRRLGG